MSQRVKLGLIGCGVIGTYHAKAMATSEDIDLVAVADLIPARVEATASRHGVRRAYASGAELLKDPEVQGVVLALPTCDRSDLTLAAFAAGKHVLSEKPIGLDAAEVRRMIAARGSQLVGACCCSRFRNEPSAKLLTAFLATGALGQLRLVRGRTLTAAPPAPTSTPPDWRLKRKLNGGGLMMNWGCYDLDYLLGLTGWKLRPRNVLAQTWSLAPHLAARATPNSEAETHAIALIRCDDGITLSLERGEFSSSATEVAHQFIGEHGSLRTTMQFGRKAAYHDHADGEHGVFSRLVWEGAEDLDQHHAGPVRDFASAILRGHAPMTGYEQALLIQTITDAIYTSAASGAAVAIP